MIYDVVIVGGGLSGVFLANRLQQQQSPAFHLLEASDRLGGRLRNDAVHDEIDLGGAWIWPDHQPKMRRLVKELDIATIQQRPVDPYTLTMRLQGGAVRIVNELAKPLADRIQYNAPVRQCRHLDDGTVQLQYEDASETTASIHAKHVVFAVPPRLLHKHVTFDPPLSAAKQAAMQRSNTWMAGVTKVTLVYRDGFWLQNPAAMQAYGRIGVVSGPAFQLYDASTTSLHALTAFTLSTTTKEDELIEQVAQQLAKVWKATGNFDLSDKAASYTEAAVQFWPHETYISEEARPTTIQPHPHPVAALATAEWNGALLFAGTETDQASAGVMEGAVGSSERVLKALMDSIARDGNCAQAGEL